ncbi:MAG: hypothetical protein J6334_03545 [Kiritimatiellae bacterium]|nr:hypothetical protein [Kiritimatiellia bacterium]
MTHGLDTSVVVRILSGLPEGVAEAVAERIATEIAAGNDFAVSPLVLSEAYFALQYHYAFTKEEALRSLSALAATSGIHVPQYARTILDKPDLARARPGFVDQMIVSEYALAGSDTYSCEKAFPRLEGTVVIAG